ncbi:hypothetical protein SUF15_09905 [Streptococcus agalactiae]|uniref:hypothetical protein n=1 Tax=Streptococcus agalactiae TaxID=1311 RepID=UPI001374DE0D|nr:hypothetical protein [Streptococcus agalactiae]KAF1260935.1 hypothetical protein B8V75_04040 [Streptococcus agalactiae]KAF1271414.1 hypothetical protein B8V71_02680 [Streptococcus agalactiae]HEN0543770.1 hypothetical protein [Streptococcus agalactiae]
MGIIELDAKYFANFGKVPPYKATEIIGKGYPDDFLTPGEEKNFLILNQEKAWIVHADSLVSVAEEIEGFLGMSVDDFIMISLGTPYHNRFRFNDDYEVWERYFKKLREAYYSDQSFK